MLPRAQFLLDESIDAPACLAERFALHAEAPQSSTVTYYDTFDWRVFRNGGSLTLQSVSGGSQWSWRSLDGTLRHRGVHAVAPGFAADLPEGPMERLAPALSMRRLLPIVEVARQRQLLRVVDDEAKTVVRIYLTTGSAKPAAVQAQLANGTSAAEPRALPTLLRVEGVRGYDRDFDAVEQHLRQELGWKPQGTDELTLAVAATGREPGDYASKLQLVLSPSMTAGQALRKIFLDLLGAIERNEVGTRRDLDSEFLHDLRVAVRRTRSALSQVKGTLPPEVLARFKDEFKWIGGLTGPTRDLDVYLLKFDDYTAALPPSIGDDLAPLHEFLVAEQRREQRRLARALGGERYRRILTDWREFLEAWDGQSTDDPETRKASRAVRKVASRRIWKVYLRIIANGQHAVDHDSPAEELHDLRIECKKLRYLMEFFKSLYDAEIQTSIKILKRLQDNLGDFNDYEVQRDKLGDFAERLFTQGKTPVATFLAMGRLQAQLEAGQDGERRRFAQCFSEFARPEGRALFERLFG